MNKRIREKSISERKITKYKGIKYNKKSRATRAVALLLGGVLLTGTGCGTTGSGSQSTADITTITVWNYYSGAQLDSFNTLIMEFNSTRGAELGIMVESYSDGSIGELTENVMASANKEVGASQMPNIFAAYRDTLYDLDDMDLIVDLSDYMTEEEQAEYIDSYMIESDLRNDGAHKLFPIAKATEIFMLNRTDWDKFAAACDVSLDDLKTVEGVTEVSRIYYEWTDSQTETPDDGKAFFGRDALGNYMIIGAKQLGVDVTDVDEQGNLLINFPEDVARQLWDNYYVPFINGYFSAAGRFRSDDVKTGIALSFVGSSASASFFPSEVILSDTEKYPIDVTVLEAPMFENGEAYAVQQGAGMAVVKASDAEIKASVEFLKWFTEVENNIRFSVASGYMPVKREANDLEKIKEHTEVDEQIEEVLQVSLDTVNSCEMYTTKGNDGDVRNILTDTMEEQAKKDREVIVHMIEAGTSRTDAVALYDTDENFESWYQLTLQELEEAAAKQNGE